MKEVENLLRPLGAEIGELLTLLDELAPGSATMLVGSVAEGIATADSDIDVLAATKVSISPVEKVAFVGNDREVNVTISPQLDLDSLVERLNAAVAHTRGERIDGAQRFSESERRVLHRLANGQPIGESNYFEELNRRSRLGELSTYLFSYHLVGYHSYIRKVKPKSMIAGASTGTRYLQIAVDRLLGGNL